MKALTLIVATGLTLLSACSDDPAFSEKSDQDAEQTETSSDVLATVDGKSITVMDRRLHQIERKTKGQNIEPDDLLEELINLKVIVVNAEKSGFSERPEVVAELNNQYEKILANLYINEHVNSLDITDDELEDEYERQLADMAATEYNASHILLNTKEDAITALERLDDGDEFGRVASEVSTGPSAENGGELGWFRQESMVPEFSAAVAELDEGEYTDEPVKTSYGWHIIRLNEARDVQHPSLEKVKDQVRQLVLNNRLNEFVQALREDSTVELHSQ
ncbi:MAG: peptidylprolyl isomerase [Pseudomonadota bacterium]